MLMPSNKLTAIVAVFLLLTGCATVEEITKNIGATQGKAEEAVAEQNKMRRSGAVVRMSGAKLAGDEVAVKLSGQLPPVFSRPFSYLSAHQPLSAILGEVGRRTGVGAAIQPADPNVRSAPAALAVPGLPSFSGGQDEAIAVDWNGDLKGLLDYLASRTRMFWKYEDGRIYFFKTETRSFHVFLPGGKRSVKSTISLTGTSGGTSGSGSSSSGTVDVSSSIEVDAYDAIIKSVQAIVSTAEGIQPGTNQGGGSGNTGTTASSRNVVANPALGIVTVTATPAILDRVASYIKSVNERFAQNVMIGVKIYNLTINKDVNAGASLTLAYKDLTQQQGTAKLTGMPLIQTLGSGTPGTFVIDAVPGSRWSGSQLIMQALEKIGDVKFVTSGQVIAANGQPSPLQVATNMNYLKERSYTPPSQVAGVFTPAIYTMTTAPLTLGFTANFLPLILGDNRIMLQYQINLSTLISMDNFGPENNNIQLPTTSTQSLQQQAFIKDGQSIVLLGFEQERATSNKSQGLTGINRNAGAERNLMVIVMEVYSGK